jgi:outer membrane protein TolC
MAEAGRQARLRFERGEIPRTDVGQAQARLAEARAGFARAQGTIAQSRAHFVAVVGAEPEGLEPPPDGPAPPASLDEAVAEALRTSPALRAAQAGVRAAEAGARYAQAGRAPTIALTATASTVRDKFFPGYRADDVTVGVQGRWTLFAGGALAGKVSEAKADVRAARAARDGAEASLREAVISAWSGLEAARAVLDAATAQAAAAGSALEDMRQEVRVGQKPTLDLLDAQRDLLAAQSAVVAARGEAVAAAWRLQALLRGG